ncbi:MAG: lysylphosphatidylglycerol synthase domain-containing protein [Dehalococcoidia bacterium]
MHRLARLRRFLWPVLHVGLATAVGVAAVVSIHDAWTARGPAGLLPLLLVLPVLLLQLVAVGVAWGLLVQAVTPADVPRSVLVRSFEYGWLCRYLPGAPGGAAGKFVALRRAGYSVAGISSALLYENLLQAGAGAAIPAATFPFIASEWEVAGWLLPLALVGAVSATGVAVLPGATPLLFRLLHRALGVADQASVRAPLRRELVAPALLLVAGAALGGLAFHFVAVSVAGWGIEDAGVTLFVFGLAAFSGWLVPFAPAGAGVREAIIVSLLGPLVGPDQALQAAIVARAANVLADILLGSHYVFGEAHLARSRRSTSVNVSNNRA